MSEEPNKRMEDLLKAYSAKRRGEAGESSIHPATRKMLQEEVRRTLKKTADDTRKESVPWRLLWPKFAIAAAVCIVLVFALIYTNERTQSRFDLAKSSDRAQHVKERERTLSTTRAPEADSSVGNSDSSAPPTIVGSTQPSPAAAPEKQLGLKDEVARRKEAEVADKVEMSANTVMTLQTAGEARVDSFSAVPRQYFAEASPRGVAVAASSSVQPRPLQRFEIERRGNRLRIIDSDGSVYEGMMVSLAASEDGKDKAANSPEQRTGGTAEGLIEAGPLDFRFEVTGTNQTINQPIRFAGVYSTKGVASTSVPATRTQLESTEEVKKSKADATATGRIAPLPSTRITGTLFIQTNQVPIHAVPAAP